MMKHTYPGICRDTRENKDTHHSPPWQGGELKGVEDFQVKKPNKAISDA